MAAIEVDERNFRYWMPRIKKSIEEATFVSFDCEFLGLPSALRGCAVSLFDTPCDRYRKLREAVCRFPPCQLGLVCYQEGNDEATYRADAFCFTLFKRMPEKEFSVSTSAITFLAEHKFDFNRVR
ncbi:CAF1 family ribonuclease [Ostertagia ostertagi]